MSQLIRVSTGQEFQLSSEIPDIETAALACARICRYGGRSRKVFWSVLIHSLIVMDLLKTPQEKLYGAFHDVASESSTSDILKPLKIDLLKEVEQQVYARTLRKWGIPLPDKSIEAAVHEADILAYLAELPTVAPKGHLPQYHRRIPKRVVTLTRKYMKIARRPGREGLEVREFLKRFYQLRKEVFGF